MKKLYKFLNSGLQSEHGSHTWTIGEWYHIDSIKICERGFHASLTPLQALGYVKGEVLSIVEVKGDSVIEDDKECWSDMRIVKAYNWKATDSVELAIYAAELVIDIYEKKYPNDKRPREAINAAKAYLKNPSKDAARAAARAGYAVDAVYAAYAVDAAASAAYAVNAAAYAVNAAAYAADAATRAARARKDVVEKLDKWFLKKIKTLTLYTV